LQHDPEDSNTLFDPAMDLSHVLAGGEGILLARTESDSASIRLAGYNPTHEQTTWVRCRFPLHAKNE
jgi:hypothetical protein